MVSRTKYGHVVTALDSAASTEIQHVLDDPPRNDPYLAIKEALLIAYDQTQAAKDAEFLSLTSLGDLKATAMLRKMTWLTSPSTASTTIFRHSFLMVLPAKVRGILATMDEPIDVLAKKADAIIEARGSYSVASIEPSSSLASLTQEVAALRLSMGNGLAINPNKCELGVTELNFLGHRVTTEGIRPMSSRVDAIRSFATPVVKKDLQRFVGMVQFYGRFIRNVGSVLKPLHECIAKKGKTVKEITWTDECAKAFSAAKEALAQAALLHHPSPSAETHLTVDASDSAIGAKLEQRHGNSIVPLAFFSRKLS